MTRARRVGVLGVCHGTALYRDSDPYSQGQTVQLPGIGLVRPCDESARNFLVRECLGFEGKVGSKDWCTWATAIRALGRIAAESDGRQLADIAARRAAEGRIL